jgi:hypothetical protein
MPRPHRLETRLAALTRIRSIFENWKNNAQGLPYLYLKLNHPPVEHVVARHQLREAKNWQLNLDCQLGGMQ